MPPIADQLGHQVAAAGSHVREHRHALADAGEVVEGELHPCRMGDRQQVQHGVGRAAQRDRHGDGVLEGLAGEDVAGLDAELQQLQHRRAGAAAVVPLALAHGLLGRAVGQREPERLDGRGHGVGGVHAAAASRPRNRGALDLEQLRIVDLAGGVAADGLEHRDDVRVPGCRAGSCRRRRTRPDGSGGRWPSRSPACSCRSRRSRRSRRSPRRRPRSRWNRRSPRATPASSACPACPWRCRRTP